MANTQTFIWTAVPNNITRDASGARFLRLSLFVTPRLAATATTAARLADYPDLLDWPSAVEGMRFSIGFGTGLIIGPANVRRLRSELLRDTAGVQIANPWAELFDQNTPVEPFVFADYATRRKLTYNVPDTRAVVTQRHEQMAAPPAPGSGTPDPSRLTEVERFQRAVETAQEGEPISEVSEFHNLVATICGYPEIARRLGLVIELETLLPAGLPTEGKVSVLVGWQPQLSKELTPSGEWLDTTFNRSPWTRYNLRADVDRFLPAARPDDVDYKNGMLALARAVGGNLLYDVNHFDVHAEALKLRSFDKQQGTERAEFPSLRSAGVGVSRGKLGDLMQRNFTDAAANNLKIANNSAGQVELFAHDLARGYRVDVRDASGNWRPLCRRAGTYTFKRSGRKVQLEDEGWVSLSAVRAAGEAAGDPSRLAIHETMFRWDGWSLCVRRPGKSVVPEGRPLGADETAESRIFSAAFKVPLHSLPRLRFGNTYSLRARVVDVAGNSHPVDDQIDALDSDVIRVLDGAANNDIPYVRYDPVLSPVPVLSEALTNADGATLKGKEGESFERLVLRTDAAGVRTPSRRHLVPPRISQADAETHGMELFDAAVGLKPEAHARIVELDRPLNEVHTEQQIELPYLPDPLAHTALIFDLPGLSPGAAYLLPFVSDAATWPRAKTWQLVLIGGSDQPSPQDPAAATDNVVTISLPEAEVKAVRISTALRAADLKKVGLWYLFKKRHGELTANKFFQPDALRPSGYHHERFNMSRQLVLVHAVQIPIFAPEYLVPAGGGEPLRVVRAKGATSAALVCDLRLPAKSAGRVELLADWDEYLDDDTQRRPDIPARVHSKVFEILLPPPNGNENVTTPDVPRCRVRGLEGEIPPETGSEPELVRREHTFGDTKHRRVTYTFSATTRFADFFPEGTSPLTNDSLPRAVHVPSSARPSAPEPISVIPIFKWTKTMTDTATTRVYTHTRAGNRVRVYLKRPWFSSGEDEFLGIVVSADPIGVNIPQTAEPHLTRIGNDVIWPALSQPRAAGYPRARRFRNALDSDTLNAIRSQGGLIGMPVPLEEAGGYPVDIVCHKVQYNPTRKLWFADIAVDPNDPFSTYSPFLKLALVRYQPFALDGLNVSPLVAADSVQLAPNRTTKVTVDKNFNQVEVEVRGTFLSDSSVTVSLERRRQFVPDQHIGWVAGPVTDEPLTPEGDGPDKVWRKTLQLGALQEYRVLVKEAETFTSDAGPYKRLVYADIFRSNE